MFMGHEMFDASILQLNVNDLKQNYRRTPLMRNFCSYTVHNLWRLYHFIFIVIYPPL